MKDLVMVMGFFQCWTDLEELAQHSLTLPKTEQYRRKAICELFRSECILFIDYLMVMKHVSALIDNTLQ